MNGGTASFLEAGARRFISSLSPYAVSLSLVYLLWGVLSDSGTHVGVEYGFSLLAALGTVGCLDRLVAHVYRGPEYLSSVSSLLGGAEFSKPGGPAVFSPKAPTGRCWWRFSLALSYCSSPVSGVGSSGP